MRLQGGTAGILAALASGRLDPLDPWLPEERRLPNLSPTNLSKIARRDKARAKRFARPAPY